MRDTYIPLFSSTLDSSLWSLDGNCLKVFLTLALKADPEGFVPAAIDGIARAAAIPIPEVIQHLRTLEGPDEYSRDLSRQPANGGRRLERVAGGWRVINIEWYRDEARRQSELSRKRRWWEERGASARRAARRTETETETETETNTETGSKREGSAEGNPRVAASAAQPSSEATDCHQDRLPEAPGHKGANLNEDAMAVPPKPRKRQQRILTECPPEFAPNAGHRTAAERHGVALEPAFEHFMAHHAAKGSRFKSWDQALHTWIIRQKSFGGGGGAARGHGNRDVHQYIFNRIKELEEDGE